MEADKECLFSPSSSPSKKQKCRSEGSPSVDSPSFESMTLRFTRCPLLCLILEPSISWLVAILWSLLLMCTFSFVTLVSNSEICLIAFSEFLTSLPRSFPNKHHLVHLFSPQFQPSSMASFFYPVSLSTAYSLGTMHLHITLFFFNCSTMVTGRVCL